MIIFSGLVTFVDSGTLTILRLIRRSTLGRTLWCAKLPKEDFTEHLKGSTETWTCTNQTCQKMKKHIKNMGASNIPNKMMSTDKAVGNSWEEDAKMSGILGVAIGRRDSIRS